MAITVVGSSSGSWAYSSGGFQYETLALPTGTHVGDLIVVVCGACYDGTGIAAHLGSAFYSFGFPLDIADDRVGNYSGSPSSFISAAGFGFASHLGDLPLRFDDPGAALEVVAAVTIITLRGVDDTFDFFTETVIPSGDPAPISSGAVVNSITGFCLALVEDIGVGAAIGDDANWATSGASAEAGSAVEVAVKAFTSTVDGNTLTVSSDAATDWRYKAWVLSILEAPPVVDVRSYLRQRQSPLNNPRVGLEARNVLRQRQNWL